MTYPRSSLLHLAEAALSRMPLAPRQAIASACGVSANSISRAIMEVHGQRFREWQQCVLLARAKALVMDGARPRSLKETATELGFSSQQSFSRWFRAETGLIPTAFRIQHDVLRHSPDLPGRGPFVREVRGTGTLVPEDLRWIPAIAEGRVERIRLFPGAAVTPDTVILELSNPALEQGVRDAALQVRAAEAQLATRHAELETALLAAQATLAQGDSDAREAQLDADAEALLHAKGLTSAIALRTKRTRAENLVARATLERERLARQQASLPSQLAIPEAEVDRQRAALGQTQAQRDGLTVRAGVVGVLQQVAVELGARVGPGTNLARVVDPTRLKAELKIPETQAKDVQLGQRATIDTRAGVVAGRVARMDPAATGGTVTVDIVLEGALPKGARPDLTIDGTIELERLADVVFVGRPAVGEDGATIQLFRLDATGHARRVAVTLGRMSASAVEVRAGLQPGDQVVLSDMAQWDDVDRVRVK